MRPGHIFTIAIFIAFFFIGLNMQDIFRWVTY